MLPSSLRPHLRAAVVALVLAGGVPRVLSAAPPPVAVAPLDGVRDTATAFATTAEPQPGTAGPVAGVSAGLARVVADSGRPRAVAYSDAYGTRLTIHRYASYATLPVFVAEYVLGNKLIQAQNRAEPVPQGTKTAHTAVAVGLGGLFALNTVTGAWNWWDARHDANGRPRRTVHSVLMLAADAGFAAAGALAGNAQHNHSGARTHRNVALASMGVAIGGGAMMYLWKD